MRERIARMRARLFDVDDRTVFWERVLALRRAHQAHGHERPTRLYALAMREIAETVSVVIAADDLVVGEPPEILLSPDEEALFAGYAQEYFQPTWFATRGHMTPAWEVLLERGLLDIRREALERSAALAPDAEAAAPRREFWEAVAICCQAVADLSARYAEQAARMAHATADPGRRAELERVSAACRRVPGLPARTFHEAVQAVWFLDFVLHAICGARDYSVGRLDQYLLPFYRRDLENGTLTREDARELLQCLFVK
ncbi:MAG: pflD, partial [candidate division NC10 bacterium]|nr:pflD [candidate division NC10 bacterium]